MSQILKVDEWQSASKYWLVADVHTWTGWREMADVLGAETQEDFIDLICNRYNAIIEIVHSDFILFWWSESNYKNAHQFKLDVNRIARKKNYMVERSF